jgi:hypothetical protein
LRFLSGSGSGRLKFVPTQAQALTGPDRLKFVPTQAQALTGTGLTGSDRISLPKPLNNRKKRCERKFLFIYFKLLILNVDVLLEFLT